MMFSPKALLLYQEKAVYFMLRRFLKVSMQNRLIHCSCCNLSPRGGKQDDTDGTSISETNVTHKKLEDTLLRPSKAAKNRITYPVKPSLMSGDTERDRYTGIDIKRDSARKDYRYESSKSSSSRSNPTSTTEGAAEDEPLLPWNREKYKNNLAVSQIIQNNPSIDYDESPRTQPSAVDQVDLMDMDSRWPEPPSDWESVKNKDKSPFSYNYGLPGEGKGKKRSFSRDSWGRDATIEPLMGEALFGKFPCLMALLEGRRTFYKLFVKKNFFHGEDDVRKSILQVAEEKQLKIEICPKRKLEALSQARPHQGVCLDATPLDTNPFVFKDTHCTGNTDLLIQSVQDPMNLGSIFRTAYYLGVNKITMTSDCCPLSPVVSKASSGVMEIMPVYESSMEIAIQEYKRRYWQILGTAGDIQQESDMAHKLVNLNKADFKENRLLVIGSEGSGLPNSVLRHCDSIIQISPSRSLHPLLDSLNVSIATGIILHVISKSTE